MRRIGDYIKNFVLTHRQMWVFSYLLIYTPWWGWLESRTNLHYHVIHSTLDDMIPFCEYFIFPYYAWFLYIPAVFLFLLIRDHGKKEFYRYTVMLYTGMTFFLVFSTLFPNIQHLRPTSFAHDNFCTMLVQMLYQMDTSTNVFPSIHVYNSIAAHMAVCHSDYLADNKKAQHVSGFVMVSIILSTMFLKQHSVIDVTGGTILALAMEQIVYRKDFVRQHQPVPRHTKRIA